MHKVKRNIYSTMKYLTIILLVLLPINLFGANVWYTSARGNNGDATSWATGKNYIHWVTELVGFVNGDTIVVGTGVLVGTMIHEAYCIDSLSYNDGFTIGTTDTTKLWGGDITVSAGALDGTGAAPDCQFIGIDFVKTGAGHIIAPGLGGWTFYNCRFRGTANNNEIGRFGSASTTDTTFLYNCEILCPANTRGFWITNASTIVAVNCTFYGQVTPALQMTSGNTQIKNCIFQNTTVGAIISHGTPTGKTHDWDYNIYYGDSGQTWTWEIGVSTFSVWQDSLQNYDVGNEVNSLQQDPTLQFVSTTCVPSSAVSCPDLGYGDEVGWFQTAGSSASTKRGQNIILIF